MRAVDTNVIVRLVTRDDENQARAAESYIASGAWISHVVLIEVAWVLASVYEFTRPQITTVMEMLLQQEHLAIQEPATVAAAIESYRHAGGLDFADCLIVEVARAAGHLPVGTFDRSLAKIDGAEQLP